MAVPIETSRDIQVFQLGSGFLTVAADSLGAIGMKLGDVVHISTEICGRMTARVCLMETLAVGANPFSLMAMTCNERDPTGLELLSGIQSELADSGFPALAVGGSTEDNMPTSMTAMGITLLGECRQLSWKIAREGDGVYLLGRPYVGREVIDHFESLPTAKQILQLRSRATTGDVIPCGSRGIGWELSVLENETGLYTKLEAGMDVTLLWRSAGPATCAIVTSSASLENMADGITRIGTLVRLS